MKTPSTPGKPRGFSLIELLMTVAVLTTLAAVAMLNLSGVVEAGREAADLRNAQQYCQIHAAARAAGVKFTAASQAGILDELIEGRRGVGVLATSEFRFPLGLSEKHAVLRLIAYDPVNGTIELRSNGR